MDETKGGALRILVLNSGSSSVKFSLHSMGPSESAFLSGSLERIGLASGLFRAARPGGGAALERALELPDHATALEALFDWMESQIPGEEPEAVGHRIVQGGPRHREPLALTGELVAEIEKLVPFAPAHLPFALKAIEAAGRRYPSIPQVACFDTSFHRHMPAVARMYPLPRALFEEGLLRYGFHGLSYEYVFEEFSREAGREAAGGRVVIAHLGNGASMAAVRGGQGVDTTMGFSPTGGLMMSSRSGDLDPGAILYLLEEKGLDAPAVRDLLNGKAGLLGVSGISSDMRDLLGREAEDRRAAEAIGLFVYLSRKSLGALAAVLGGLDTLIFTGGIGENSAPVRWRICQGLEFLGIRIDPSRNSANAPVISEDGSPASVRVIRTDEDRMIARHAFRVLRGGAAGAAPAGDLEHRPQGGQP